MGLQLVKLFPGNALGPSFMQAIRELFPEMLFMPTGGVDTSRENLGQWFNAGVCAVGMGSKLITQNMLQEKNYEAVSSAAANILTSIQSIKKS